MLYVLSVIICGILIFLNHKRKTTFMIKNEGHFRMAIIIMFIPLINKIAILFLLLTLLFNLKDKEPF